MGRSAFRPASTIASSGAYQPAAPNWPTQDQSTSVTSAGAVPATSEVTILVRMSSQPSVSRLSLMPVCSVKRSVMSLGSVGQGGNSNVMLWPA